MTFFDSTVDSVKSAFCLFVNTTDKGTSFFNELNPLDDVPSYGPFWNRVLCNRNETLPQSPPQFTGGQCDVLYTVEVDWTGRASFPACNPSPQNRSRTGLGPVSGVNLSVTARPDIGPNTEEREITIGFADGVQVLDSVFADDRCPETVIDNISVTRDDGLPDDCGNPSPVIPPFPPQGDTVNIDITYVNNEGDNVTELGDLTIFAPVVIAPVTIVAPIRVDLPDVSFNGNIVLSPDFNVELSPPSYRRGPGDSDDSPPVDRPDTDPSTPEDDSPRRVIGAITTVTAGLDGGKATEIDGASGPDLFVPRLGTLAFRVRAGVNLSWSEAFDIKTTSQFHPAPENVQSLDAIATANPGYSIAVTLVYSDSQT